MGVLIVSCCFIAADVITGLVKAFYCHNVNSTILRKGLYHKIAELMANKLEKRPYINSLGESGNDI